MKKLFTLIIFFSTFNTLLYSQNSGCTDSLAYNYDSLAVIDDGSCFYLGCFYSQIGQGIDAQFGLPSSISLSSNGKIVAIGKGGSSNGSPWSPPGVVKVYENINGLWTQLGQNLNGSSPADGFGYSVSLSSDGYTIAIGAPWNSSHTNDGIFHIFNFDGSNWNSIGGGPYGLNGADGISVSLSSDAYRVAFSDPYSNNGAGSVSIYQWNGGAYSPYIWPSGNTVEFIGESPNDNSGHAISLSGDGNTIAIGAPFNSDNGLDAGHVRIYQDSGGGIWNQIGSDIDGDTCFYNSGYLQTDKFGMSVSLSFDGSRVAIGAPTNAFSSRVVIYENVSGSWVQIGQDITFSHNEGKVGHSVSLSSDGNKLAIGGLPTYNNSGSVLNPGFCRIYDYSSGSWSLNQEIIGSHPNDRFGYNVTLSSDGSTVANGNNEEYLRGLIMMLVYILFFKIVHHCFNHILQVVIHFIGMEFIMILLDNMKMFL